MVPVVVLPPYTRTGKGFSLGGSGADGRRVNASVLQKTRVQVASLRVP